MTNNQEAQRTFEQALTLDPRSVGAKIGLATELVSTVVNGWSSSVEQDEARAEQLLIEALERDPNSSMAHFSMGQLRQAQNRLSEACAELEAAVVLDRNNAHSLAGLARMLRFLGRPQAGIPHIEQAIQLNPRDPNIGLYYRDLGCCHLLLGDVGQAIDLFRKAIAAIPRYSHSQLWLAGALGLRGDLEEARAALSESLKLNPKISSFARWRSAFPVVTNPDYLALAEKTVNLGLRRAGFPEE
jgi:tetratricopeptide (TPR) repeat protein